MGKFVVIEHKNRKYGEDQFWFFDTEEKGADQVASQWKYGTPSVLTREDEIDCFGNFEEFAEKHPEAAKNEDLLFLVLTDHGPEWYKTEEEAEKAAWDELVERLESREGGNARWYTQDEWIDELGEGMEEVVQDWLKENSDTVFQYQFVSIYDDTVFANIMLIQFNCADTDSTYTLQFGYPDFQG